jgi:hypothetical protein
MAKYTINHSCGHSREIQLFGKNDERERKIEWMGSQECPKCWGEKKRSEEEKLPITAIIRTNGMDADDKGNILAEIMLTGGTKLKKEEIKKMGYSWGQSRGGIMDMLSVNKPHQGWIKRIPLLHLAESHQVWKSIKTELETLGADIQSKISAIDMDTAVKNIFDKKEKDIKMAQIEKPQQPECFPSKRGRWNGTIYGNIKNGFRVYIDGSEEKITEEEAEEIKNYILAREKYNVEIEKIKRGE